MNGRPARVHPAVRGFDRSADAYERGRPGYPTPAVRWLARTLRIGPGTTVVELGCGTGKFTRGLAATGAAVVAIEPIAGMRRVFGRVMPSTLVLDAVAEAIPLPDAFADAVVSAQAFQWFRPASALREISRVLRPHGGLGLVWNVRDESVPFSRRITELIDRHGGSVWHARDARWREGLRRYGRDFGRLRRRSFVHVQRMTPAAVEARVLSISAVATLPDAERRKVLREVRGILAEDPSTAGRAVVRFRYRTDVFLTRRTR